MQKFSLNIMAVLAMATITAVASAQPASFTDLGNIGNSGTFVFDTIGSILVGTGTGVDTDADTELALYDSTGILLAADDDGAGVGFFDQITATLADGEYFLAVSEFDSIFEDGFINSGTGLEPGEIAEFVINIDGAFAGSASASGDGAETAFFRAEVGNAIPEPATASLLVLGGLATVLRRRRS